MSCALTLSDKSLISVGTFAHFQRERAIGTTRRCNKRTPGIVASALIASAGRADGPIALWACISFRRVVRESQGFRLGGFPPRNSTTLNEPDGNV